MEAAFCWLKMLVIKNDHKSQITVFLFLFAGTYAKGSCGLLCTCPTIRYLQHIPKKKYFRLSTFNRATLFRVNHVI
jgi:hypothetical protein